MSKLIQLQQVSKQYDSNTNFYLQEISFSLEKGRCLALLGESGSGKTSILRLIAGLEDLNAGTILFQNEKLAGPSDKLVAGNKGIKLINQNLNLPPKQSIQESIAYELRGHVEQYKNERTQELLELFQLEELADKHPHQLSGGQRQRALIAWALADSPELLLMDEPLSHLDDIFKDYMYKVIFRLIQKNKTTVIFATHQVKEVYRLADEVIILEHGKMIQQGEPEAIHNHPNTSHAARLTGESNIVDAESFYKLISNKEKATIHQGKKLCIRPRDISISSEAKADIVAEVSDSRFMGGYYEITCVLKNKGVKSVELFLYSSKADIAKGDSIPLLFKKSGLVVLQD